ncbi:MAG: 16S rRNA (cytosine(1402)-N(4))-methyltransferase RsmH [Anaerolineales bacterium]|nr:16S rRNA (cytosine(1402)-N(4))-methyltransferase RsmH [Anaerolineales bacterium]
MTAAQAEAGPTEHIPVLYQSVLEWLDPRPGRRYLDGTVGGGGHTEGILRQGAEVLGLDRDAETLRVAAQRLAPFAGRLVLRQASYRRGAAILAEIGWRKAAGILLDLGLSSLQLADPSRGFAFRQDGPLDMRFDRSGGESAADLVNTLPEEEIADLLFRYGEERRARRIAKAIVRNRPIGTTRQLAGVIAATAGFSEGGRSRMHPATRAFQALRIAVNHELDELERALPVLMECLEDGGRLAVISFQSLEDRIVKQTFRKAAGKPLKGERSGPGPIEEARFRELTKKPAQAEAEELAENPRSRSAKLRVLEKIGSADGPAGGTKPGH